MQGLVALHGGSVEARSAGVGRGSTFITRLPRKAVVHRGSRSDAPPASPAVAAGPTCSLLIAVTGWGQQEDRERSRAAGFDHHLTKPVDTDTLQRLLSESSSRLHRAADRRG